MNHIRPEGEEEDKEGDKQHKDTHDVSQSLSWFFVASIII
jgi:hypothetical protein